MVTFVIVVVVAVFHWKPYRVVRKSLSSYDIGFSDAIVLELMLPHSLDLRSFISIDSTPSNTRTVNDTPHIDSISMHIAFVVGGYKRD